jgi:hypothetical protein
MKNTKKEVTVLMLVKEDTALEGTAAWLSLREHSEAYNLLVQQYWYR